MGFAMKIKIFFCLLLLISLTACGTDPKDRIEGGAATGATTGMAIGILAGPPGIIAGAIIGGGLGAATGATVPEDNLDLGEPIWKNH